MKIKHNHNNSSGFTLVELLVYVTGLVLLGSALSLMVVQFYGLYKEIVALPKADRTGLVLVDRLTKEIRSAKQIDGIESIFNSTNGVLDLDVVEDDVMVEKKFYVENGIIKYQEDSEEPVELSSNDFTVSNFNFTLVSSPVSEAIKFDIELQFQTRNATETKSYTGFAILRESYE